MGDIGDWLVMIVAGGLLVYWIYRGFTVGCMNRRA